MAPATHSTDAEWTVETLRVYLVDKFEAQDRRSTEQIGSLREMMLSNFVSQKEAVNTAMAAAKEAVAKAENASDKRFDSVNEFRDTLADQQRTLMPRIEADTLFRTISEKIELLRADIASLQGSRSATQGGVAQADKSNSFDRWAIGIGITAAGVFVGIILGAVEAVLKLSGH